MRISRHLNQADDFAFPDDFLEPLFPFSILLLLLEFRKFTVYRLKAQHQALMVFSVFCLWEGGREEGVWVFFSGGFFVAVVDIRTWLCVWLDFCMLSSYYQQLLLNKWLQCSLLGDTVVSRNLLAEMRFPSGLKKGRREDVTSPQHNNPGRALSEGMLTRYFAGWLCPVWRLFNCADVQLRLSLTACPQQSSGPWAQFCAFGDHSFVLQEPGQCSPPLWNRFWKSCVVCGFCFGFGFFFSPPPCE